MGLEAETGKLQKVRCNNGGVLPLKAYGKHPQENFGTKLGCGHRGRERDIYRVYFPRVIASVACTVEG